MFRRLPELLLLAQDLAGGVALFVAVRKLMNVIEDIVFFDGDYLSGVKAARLNRIIFQQALYGVSLPTSHFDPHPFVAILAY